MLSLILVILAGFFNAVMDVLFTRFEVSVFKSFNPDWWNPAKSWKQKWKMPLTKVSKSWYSSIFPTTYQERFPLSSTSLVWLTDAWHMAKALMLACLFVAVTVHETIWSTSVDWLIYYVCFTSTFTLFYSKLLVKN